MLEALFFFAEANRLVGNQGSTAKPEDFSLYAKIVASLKRKNFVSLTPLN
jgi:hypothetical protein